MGGSGGVQHTATGFFGSFPHTGCQISGGGPRAYRDPERTNNEYMNKCIIMLLLPFLVIVSILLGREPIGTIVDGTSTRYNKGYSSACER